jgi:hypothetical protein
VIASERLFRDFGSPVTVEDGTTMWDYSYDFASTGGGGGWGPSGWPDDRVGGGIRFDFGGFNVAVDPRTFGGGSGTPDVKVTLTRITDGYETALKSNLDAWKKGSLTASQAISQGTQLLNQWAAECLRYGDQGRKTVEERDRRMQSPRLRWDWIGYYLDPITQAAEGKPANPPPPSTVGGAPGPISYSGIGALPPMSQTTQLLVFGGLFLLAFVLLEKT